MSNNQSLNDVSMFMSIAIVITVATAWDWIPGQTFQPSLFDVLPPALPIFNQILPIYHKNSENKENTAYLKYFLAIWMWNITYYTFLSYNL